MLSIPFSTLEISVAKRTSSAANSETAEQRHTRIYKTIRERISLLQYAPGSVLSEAELASEFSVSRTPIRKVLQRLHYEGLVDARNGVGTIVTDINLKTLKEIYDLRMRLAELMGELSPTVFTQEHTEGLEQLQVQAIALRGTNDYEGYARLCNDVEEIMLTMIGSEPLREITDLFYYRVSRIWFTFLPQLDWDEMVAFQEKEIISLLDAVKRNDIKGVGQIRRIYLHGVLRFLSEYLGTK